MNDNLASMIDESDQQSSGVSTETDLNVDNQSEIDSTQDTPSSSTFDIGVIPFPDWFEQNHSNFSEIGHVRVSISDVDPRQDLIFKIPDPKGGQFEDGRPKKRLRLFEDADEILSLNIPGQEMVVFKNNSFWILYDIGSGRFIRSYGVKTGLINVFCISINNMLIPYAKAKMKKKDEGIDIIDPNLSRIQSKLTEHADAESLQIQYKQITKSIAEISTVGSAVNWFIAKSKEVHDVNHLLQIDDVLINLVN